MKLDVLMSTMNQKNYNLINNANIKSGVIVNQTDRNDIITISDSIKWLNSTTLGLSKSRNIALENTTADICLLGDDDLEYIAGFEKIILKEFAEKKSDIICFQVEGIERKFKDYSPKEKEIGYLEALKISSVQIAFRRSSIERNKIKFDENFGAGTEIYMGEENIFLYDCLSKGLKIKYVPKKIADLHITSSSWFEGFNEKYLENRGAIFYRMTKKMYILLIVQFAIRKRKLFSNMNLIEIIMRQLSGVQYYKEKYKI